MMSQAVLFKERHSHEYAPAAVAGRRSAFWGGPQVGFLLYATAQDFELDLGLDF